MDFRNSPLLRRLAVSGGIRIASLCVATIAGLILTPYMLSKLGENDCGLMVFTMTVMSFINLMEAGLNAAVSRHVAAALGSNDDDQLLRYFNSGFFMFLFVGLASIGVTLLLVVYLDQIVVFSEWVRTTLYHEAESTAWSDSDTGKRNIRLVRIMLMILSGQFAVELMLRSLIGVVSGALRADIISAAFLFTKILRPCLNYAILFFGGGVIALTTGGALVTVAWVPFWFVVVHLLVPKIRISRKFFDLEATKRLYKFGLVAFASTVMQNLHASVAILLMTSMQGLATVAIYSMICTSLYGNGATVAQMLSSYLAPIFAQLGARNEKDTMRKTVFFAVKASTGLAAFVTFGLIAWGHPFIERWTCMNVEPELAAQRIAAYIPLVVMSFIILFEQSQAPTVELLYGTATHRYYALINTVEAVLAILMFPWLIGYYGMLGTAVSLLIASAVVRLILQPYFVSKVLEIPLWKYYRGLLAVVMKAAICLIPPGMATGLLVQASYYRLFLLGGLCTLLFFPPFIMIAFTKEERDIVFHALLKRRSKET